MTALLLQTFGPVLFGILFLASGILKAEPKWVGRLTFLLAQIVQIYAMGLGSILGLGLVACILGGFAVTAAMPAISRTRQSGAVAGFFAVYMLYWLLEKYIAPHFAVGGASAFAAPAVAIVGISYIGFKFIHAYVDYRTGDVATIEPIGFVAWLLFFPSIVAGPMQRYQDWCEQFGTTSLTADRALGGLRRILLGLFMKVALADNIYNLTLPHMSPEALLTAPWSAIIAGSLVYSLYLYFDFAGYSHLAIGTGAFWGISLPENFNNPYIARNLAEFWNRWHITLSQILRDYLFYPLSLKVKRTPRLRDHRAIAAAIPPVVTFLVAGLWHGAAIGYILYGLLHGVGLAYLAIRRGTKTSRSPRAVWWANSRARRLMATAFNFLYVSLTFVFFSLTAEKLAILAGRLL